LNLRTALNKEFIASIFFLVDGYGFVDSFPCLANLHSHELMTTLIQVVAFSHTHTGIHSNRFAKTFYAKDNCSIRQPAFF